MSNSNVVTASSSCVSLEEEQDELHSLVSLDKDEKSTVFLLNLDEDDNQTVIFEASDSRTPLPTYSLIACAVVFLCESFALSFYWPFVGFMVKDFDITEDERKLGYFVGMLASARQFCQFLSVYGWGRVSDRRGRKPCMIFGLLGNCLAVIAFGFSKSFVWAISVRCLAGLVTGNVVIVKSSLRDMTDESNRATAFSMLGTVWGVGMIVGPLVGGFLSHAHEKYPSVFSAHLFGEYPYLLPCIVAAALNVLGIVVCALCYSDTSVLTPAEMLPMEEELEETTQQCSENEDEHSPLPPPQPITTGVHGSGTIRWFRGFAGPIFNIALMRRKPNFLMCSSPLAASKRSTLFTRDTILAVLGYAGIAFIAVCFDEVFNVWVIRQPSNHGLGFNSNQIGYALTIAGVTMFIFQVFFYERLDRLVGTLKLYRLSLIAQIPFYALVPLLSLSANKSPWIVWSSLVILLLYKTIATQITFTSVDTLIGNSADPSNVGSVFGMAVSTAALARTVGPLMAGSIFSATSANTTDFPFDWHLIFWVMSLAVSLSCAMSFLMKPPSKLKH